MTFYDCITRRTQPICDQYQVAPLCHQLIKNAATRDPKFSRYPLCYRTQKCPFYDHLYRFVDRKLSKRLCAINSYIQ